MTPLRTFACKTTCTDRAALYRRVMVAHTATTPTAYATGCLPTSAPSSPAPRATDPLRVSASPPSAPSLSHPTPTPGARPPPSPPSSPHPPSPTKSSTTSQFPSSHSRPSHRNTASPSAACSRGSISPETREVLALRESAAYAHARHVAALNIGHAVETVASIVRDYNTTRPEREAQDRKTPGSAHRAATNARKAAWLLLQFARIVPVNEADLSRMPPGWHACSKSRHVLNQPVRRAGCLPRIEPRVVFTSERISRASDSSPPQASRFTRLAFSLTYPPHHPSRPMRTPRRALSLSSPSPRRPRTLRTLLSPLPL
jgi:hypothetical protein